MSRGTSMACWRAAAEVPDREDEYCSPNCHDWRWSEEKRRNYCALCGSISVPHAGDLIRAVELVAAGLEADGRTADGMTKSAAAKALRAAIAKAEGQP